MVFIVVVITFVSLVLFAKQVGSDFQSKLKETLHISSSLKNSFRCFTTFLKENSIVYVFDAKYFTTFLKENNNVYISYAKFKIQLTQEATDINQRGSPKVGKR